MFLFYSSTRPCLIPSFHEGVKKKLQIGAFGVSIVSLSIILCPVHLAKILCTFSVNYVFIRNQFTSFLAEVLIKKPVHWFAANQSTGFYMIGISIKKELHVVSTTFLLICFVSLKGTTCALGKMFFISLQKLFSFSRKSKLRILDTQISWRHQMPKHIKETHFAE